MKHNRTQACLSCNGLAMQTQTQVSHDTVPAVDRARRLTWMAAVFALNMGMSLSRDPKSASICFAISPLGGSKSCSIANLAVRNQH